MRCYQDPPRGIHSGPVWELIWYKRYRPLSPTNGMAGSQHYWRLRSKWFFMRFLHLSIGRSSNLKTFNGIGPPETKQLAICSDSVSLTWYIFIVWHWGWMKKRDGIQNQIQMVSGQCYAGIYHHFATFHLIIARALLNVTTPGNDMRTTSRIPGGRRPLSSNWADTKKQSENSCIPEVHRSLNSRLGQGHGGQLCGLESSIYHLTGSLSQDFMCICQKM